MPYKNVFTIEGIDCALCAARIQDAVGTIEGVGSATIDLVSNRLEIVSERRMDGDLERQVRSTVRLEEPDARIIDSGKVRQRKRHSVLIPARIVFAIMLIAAAPLLNFPFNLALAILAYGVSGHDVVSRALGNTLRGKLFDEYVLMTIATLGAFLIGEHAEAVAVMAFYQAGEYLQDMAVRRSRDSIAKLMDIQPNQAHVLRGEKLEDIDVGQIVVGDTMVIRAGEKVPVDAVVTEGSSSLDTSALTGESVLRPVETGQRIISGCVNGSGVLYARAMVRYEDSTVATILRLVEESGMRKAKTERFITRFARIYTPIVVLIALLITTIGTLAGGSFDVWLYRALVFLVISCPCALVLSVPLGFFGGIGGLARIGVLVKGGQFIQTLATTRTVVFDKTGTLTEGKFSVTNVESLDPRFTPDDIHALASSLEAHATHPLARAIVDGYGGTTTAASDVTESSGLGIRGIIDGKEILVGSARYLAKQLPAAMAIPQERETEVFVACDGLVIGRIILLDAVKEEGPAAIGDLKRIGVERMVILSGDNEAAVRAVGEHLGISQAHFKLLPQDKLAHLEQLLAEQRADHSVAFVGDGVNDAPVLARADVGIAMGALGSDAAVEAADVVIMTDDLSRIGAAIVHSRRTMRIIRQNITLALGIKAMVMILGGAGFASMWLAVFADTGVALLAILNSLRALRTRT